MLKVSVLEYACKMRDLGDRQEHIKNAKLSRNGQSVEFPEE